MAARPLTRRLSLPRFIFVVVLEIRGNEGDSAENERILLGTF